MMRSQFTLIREETIKRMKEKLDYNIDMMEENYKKRAATGQTKVWST
jgi:hypothetical protein